MRKVPNEANDKIACAQGDLFGRHNERDSCLSDEALRTLGRDRGRHPAP
jgi:hypothetical protein